MEFRKRRVAAACVAAMATFVVALAAMSVDDDALLWKLVLVAAALALPGLAGAIRRPGNPVGWLLLAMGFVFTWSALATQLVSSGHAAAAWAIWFADRSSAVLVPLAFAVLMLLPDGELPSPRWRHVMRPVLASQLLLIAAWSIVQGPAAAPGSDLPAIPRNPVGLLPNAWGEPLDAIGAWVLQAPFLLAALALALRLVRRADRRSTSVALAGGLAFVALAVVGRLLWPGGADVLDVLGATLLGATLTVAIVREVPHATPTRHPQQDAPPATCATMLSAREREVLELVAQGLTNREIAEELVISPITARNHVSNILAKLGLSNRTQAATWLSEHRTPA